MRSSRGQIRRIARILVFTVPACACALPGRLRAHDVLPPREAPDSVENRFSCGAWMWAPPKAKVALLDIDRAGLDDTTTIETLESRVQAAGGRIVHSFQLPRVRAVMNLKRALALTGEVTLVRDSTRLDVPVQMTVRGPFTTQDGTRFADAGARLFAVTPFGDPPRAYWQTGIVPDSLIPTLRGHANVARVGPLGMICVLGGAGESRR